MRRFVRPRHALARLAVLAALTCAASGLSVTGASASGSAPSVSSEGFAPAPALTSPSDIWRNTSVSPQGLLCTDVSDCTAVGYVETTTGIESFVMTESSGTWGLAQVVPVPSNAYANPNAELQSVSCTSATACVAVGWYKDASGNTDGLIETESGGTWTPTEASPPTGAYSNPESMELQGVSCPASGGCVAVGLFGNSSDVEQALVLNESSGAWGQAAAVSLPANANTALLSRLGTISCPTVGNCTAAGFYYTTTSNYTAGMILNEASGSWGSTTGFAAPSGASNLSNSFSSVSCSDATDCTAIGDFYGPGNHEYTQAATETAGTWGAETGISAPSDISATSPTVSPGAVTCWSAGNCLATGNYTTTSGTFYAPYVANESGGSWSQATGGFSLPSDASSSAPSGNLSAAFCSDVTDCIAIGSYATSDISSRGLLLAESSGTWGTGQEALPPTSAGAGTGSTVEETAISCAAAGECAAAGIYRGAQDVQRGLIGTESGGSWTQSGLQAPTGESTTNPAETLDGISCADPGDCTAIGYFTNTSSVSQIMAASSSGGTWGQEIGLTLPSNAEVPSTSNLVGVSCPSAGNCTAVGQYTDSSVHRQGLVAVEVGGSWSQATELPVPANASANPAVTMGGINCADQSDCTAVGTYLTSSAGYQNFVATEATGVWTATEVASPSNAKASNTAELRSIWCSDASDCVAVGYYTDTSNVRQADVAVETSGVWGQATEVAEPVGFGSSMSPNSISCTSAGNCLAVGSFVNTASRTRGFAFQGIGGVWSAATALPAPVGESAVTPQTQPLGVACTSNSCDIVGFDSAIPGLTQGFDQQPGTALVLDQGTNDYASVTATGAPTPTLDVTGALPAGVSFIDEGNGTGEFSGVPTGAGGVYPVTVTATNTNGSSAQTFDLDLDGQPTSFSSAATTAFSVGSGGTFTATANGYPSPAFTETGALPQGVTLASSGTLSGTPAAGTGGAYPITLTATNAAGSAQQSFDLEVDQRPTSFSSAATTAFSVGSGGTFTATANGYPSPAFTETGALPQGVTLASSGTLSGTPAAGTGGAYPITLTATNAAGSGAQSFELDVNQPPAITSVATASFLANGASSFSVATSGYPAPALAITSGTLPQGLTFSDNGNGTATISGSPTAAGVADLSIQATSSSGTASQLLEITIASAPSTSSSNPSPTTTTLPPVSVQQAPTTTTLPPVATAPPVKVKTSPVAVSAGGSVHLTVSVPIAVSKRPVATLEEHERKRWVTLRKTAFSKSTVVTEAFRKKGKYQIRLVVTSGKKQLASRTMTISVK